MHRYETFIIIIRYWSEPVAAGETVLRGSIEDVRSGERVYFQTSEDLCAKIEQFFDPSSSVVEPEERRT